MDAESVDATLAACERALASSAPPDLRAVGFWRAVAAVKRHPEWTDRFAERIAQIDRRAFLARVRLVLPLPLGVALLLLGSAVGVVLLGAAFALEPMTAGIAALLGTGALIGATHDLAHLVVGRAVGIRFTHWYVDLPKRPQPGVKLDYASYLRTSARSRAWMHVSGAVVTKLVPFAGALVALAARVPWWAAASLVAIGVAQLVTDALFSVRAGDWKKFRRELRIARATSGG
ncbi:MAG: hypothetical protein M3O91_00890 [Chloroflexota bacterium]|nr:hypothetical protein [Chloroflexota bacterium]